MFTMWYNYYINKGKNIMPYTLVMQQEDIIINLFNEAVNDTDNHTDEGTVIWDYVFGDVWIRAEKYLGTPPEQAFYDLDGFLDQLVEEYFEFGQVEYNFQDTNKVLEGLTAIKKVG